MPTAAILPDISRMLPKGYKPREAFRGRPPTLVEVRNANGGPSRVVAKNVLKREGNEETFGVCSFRRIGDDQELLVLKQGAFSCAAIVIDKGQILEVWLPTR